MPPIDNIGSFSGFPQSVPSSAAEASSSAGASEGAGRARTDTEFLALWDEWERNAPQGGGEQRRIAVERLQDCLKRNAVDLDLGHLSLTSLPELPSQVEVLWVHSNSLSELPALPASMRELYVFANKLTHLPEPLPSSLQVLSASENQLAELPALPSSLRHLIVFGNKLTHLPASLPSSLEVLSASANQLAELPALPSSLRHLIVFNNELTQLSEPLPSSLEVFSASGNQLEGLPALPASLRELYVFNNKLTHLPEPLPSSLEVLSASGNHLAELPALPSSLRRFYVNNNQLTHLPEPLPTSLEILSASENQLEGLPALPLSLREFIVDDNKLQALPPLPSSLRRLSVAHNQLTELSEELPESLAFSRCQDNRLTQLPESISRLPGEGEVLAESNPFSERTIQALQNLGGDPGYHGPTVYFSMQVSGAASRPARPLGEAVAAWLPSESEAKTAGRWEAIAKEDGAPAFSAFLDHLQDTISAQNVPGFKEQVAAWLTRLSETPALREKTFLVSVGATESCQDRVALTWNNMQKAELEHRIACGACDQNLPEVVSAGREMFRLEQLDQIAREKAGTLRFVDEIEVHLAFQTKVG